MAKFDHRNVLARGAVRSGKPVNIMQVESPGATSSCAAMRVASGSDLWIVCRLVQVAGYRAKSARCLMSVAG